MRVTLTDVAREAGVSKTTVSLALRSHPRITKSVRDHVNETALRLGYMPSPILSQIASSRWKNVERLSRPNIAFLSPYYSASNRLDSWFIGASEAADKLGYNIENFQLSDYKSPEHTVRVLQARGMEGIIIPPVRVHNTDICLDWSHFSCVHIDVGMNHPPLHCVRPNYIEASSQAWKLAQQHSAGKIGYVLVIEEDDEWHSRDLAACLLFKNYAPGRERMVPPLILRPADYLPLGPWLSQHNPDLIVTNNPGTHWALVELKIRVPDEVQIIGLNIYERDFMSGFRLLNQEMGVAAMHILDSLVRLGERGIPVYRQTHLMELLWNPGTTLRTTARK